MNQGGLKLFDLCKGILYLRTFVNDTLSVKRFEKVRELWNILIVIIVGIKHFLFNSLNGFHLRLGKGLETSGDLIYSIL